MEGVEDRGRRQREQYRRRRDRETEEQRQVRLERRREYDRRSVKEPSKYLTPLLVLLVFNGETWPTTTPCTVTGADDALVPDTATSSSTMTHVARWLPT